MYESEPWDLMTAPSKYRGWSGNFPVQHSITQSSPHLLYPHWRLPRGLYFKTSIYDWYWTFLKYWPFCSGHLHLFKIRNSLVKMWKMINYFRIWSLKLHSKVYFETVVMCCAFGGIMTCGECYGIHFYVKKSLALPWKLSLALGV